MPRINQYAVVDAESGEVVGQHLINYSDRIKPKLNGIKLDYMDENDEGCVITKTITVNLSSTKGNIDKIISPFNPPMCIYNSSTGNLFIHEK